MIACCNEGNGTAALPSEFPTFQRGSMSCVSLLHSRSLDWGVALGSTDMFVRVVCVRIREGESLKWLQLLSSKILLLPATNGLMFVIEQNAHKSSLKYFRKKGRDEPRILLQYLYSTVAGRRRREGQCPREK